MCNQKQTEVVYDYQKEKEKYDNLMADGQYNEAAELARKISDHWKGLMDQGIDARRRQWAREDNEKRTKSKQEWLAVVKEKHPDLYKKVMDKFEEYDADFITSSHNLQKWEAEREFICGHYYVSGDPHFCLHSFDTIESYHLHLLTQHRPADNIDDDSDWAMTEEEVQAILELYPEVQVVEVGTGTLHQAGKHGTSPDNPKVGRRIYQWFFEWVEGYRQKTLKSYSTLCRAKCCFPEK